MELIIKKALIDHSMTLFGTEIDESTIQFQKTRKDVNGDLTLVTFPFVKILRCSPVEAGNKIGTFLTESIDEIESCEAINGFLNIILSDAYWIHQLDLISKEERFGYAPANSKPTIMVEYSSPNTNKPLHLGHLRNNFLGYSVAEILKANGHKVVKTQIINDRGIHICKSMLAWERFSPLDENGKRETPESTGMKGDKLVGKYYVIFDREMNAEAKEILQAWNNGKFDGFEPEITLEVKRLIDSKVGKDEKAIAGIDAKIKEIAKNQTALLNDAKEMLVKWEGRDPQVYLLWTTMNSWVYKGFESTYEMMGVDFDQLYYESDTFLLGKELIAEGLTSGVFYRKDDGSVWIDLSEEGLDEKLVLRSDGTAVYITQDIGTAVDRFKDYPDLDGIIYTVGNEQDHHFKVLFLIIKKLGYAWAENCHHLSYGMVELPKGMGRMKSREGTVVDADDLMEDIIDSAREMTQERGQIEGMSEVEKQHLFKTIGLGGLKYYLLKVDPKKKLVFDPNESIELNGNTGPFIQYTHARIKSMIAKINQTASVEGVSALASEEKAIVKQLVEFKEVIIDAGANRSPALIANYAYELVKQFNHFYQKDEFNILKEENAQLRSMRLLLSENVAKIIANSMRLLGVQVPERM